MKTVWTGIESSGKSLQLSITADRVLQRNKRWLAKSGVPRTMFFDSPMSPTFAQEIQDAGLRYREFHNLEDIIWENECDVFINEVLKFFPASGSSALSAEQMDFLSQGAKSGVHLWCASQDFSQVHKQFRLLVNDVFVCTKIIGSRRPIKSAPPVRFIWGLCMMRKVHPSSFKGDSATMESIDLIPSFFLIHKQDCDRFDTSYKVPLTQLPTRVVRRQDVIGYDENGAVAYSKTNWV